MSERVPTRLELPVQFSEIASEINAMAKADQDMRQQSIEEDGSWDDTVDAKNTKRMKVIVARIGWPTVSRVGEEPSSNAWLLVQHADLDVDFQEQCLALMKQQPDGEVALRNIAMLEDRVRVNRKQPQLYGTQFRQISGEHKYLPIEDELNVDERRKKMGMESLQANIARMYEQYGKPKED